MRTFSILFAIVAVVFAAFADAKGKDTPSKTDADTATGNEGKKASETDKGEKTEIVGQDKASQGPDADKPIVGGAEPPLVPANISDNNAPGAAPAGSPAVSPAGAPEEGLTTCVLVVIIAASVAAAVLLAIVLWLMCKKSDDDPDGL